ncbi:MULTISPECIES: TVP38/TMEM64 family protein [Clostridium]|uniref:TVP38/TMEM64 family membrane protein n=1 Tax=Clostridium cibarium TaxID=2762247 RepID=A0ABR8PR85_9CLOT|nr:MULTISPECIES: TVP38/TMEM64 family protein [Clostridium]MBD7910686.1 TVP38/TMEM64 family protein [Clostridium cibarium]
MSNNKKLEKIKFLIFVCIVVVAIIIVATNWRFIRGLRVEKIVHFIADKGPYAVAIYLLIYAIKPFLVVIPSNVLVIVSGVLFGPVKGSILSMIGFGISGAIAFYLARFLGKDFVQSIIGKRFIKLDDNMKKDGFRILFLLRLLPVIPYDPLSYACGFTNMKFSSFLAASVLGVSIETICYSVLGKNFRNPFSWKFFLPLLIIIIVTIFSKKVMKGKKDN